MADDDAKAAQRAAEPYLQAMQARLDGKADALKRATEELGAAQDRIAELEKGAKGFEKASKAWESTVAELDSYKAKETAWTTERAIMGAGVTDQEGLDQIGAAWARIPAEERHKDGVTGWLGERDKLARGVAVYLPALENENGETKKTETREARWDPNKGATHATGTERHGVPGRLHDLDRPGYASVRDSAFESLGTKAPTYSFLPKKD